MVKLVKNNRGVAKGRILVEQIVAVMRAATFCSLQPRVCDRLGDGEQIEQVQRSGTALNPLSGMVERQHCNQDDDIGNT